MINYIVGDATEPIGNGEKFIFHVVNDIGVWGAGFVKALSAKWPEPEKIYREAHPYILGYCSLASIDLSLFVVNMVAQHGTISKSNPHPLKLDALADCFEAIKPYICYLGDSPSIHMPRIGCGLGGGSWDEVEPVIKKHLSDFDVYVYDLPHKEQ